MEFITTDSFAIVLFFIGLLGLVVRKNMMFIVVSTSIIDAAIILFFINSNNHLLESIPGYMDVFVTFNDPIPHALMITSVVIGVAVKAVILILILQHYKFHQTLDLDLAQAISDPRPEN